MNQIQFLSDTDTLVFDYLLDCLCANPDIESLDFSCGSNYTLFLRDDISEMEAAAKKFEQEGGILEEIHRQARSGDNLYSPCFSYMFQRAEEDGYSPYCEIKFELKPQLSVTTQDLSQEVECIADSLLVLSSAKENMRSEVSEASVSCVEPLESSFVPNNVRSSSLIAKCGCLL
jgi:hypothetical protein